MYSLTSCFIKNDTESLKPLVCETTLLSFYPVRIAITPNKTENFFFQTQSEQRKWIDALQKEMRYSSVFDFYKFEKTLGSGQFGLVKMATHLKTGVKVAIKQVKKKNMTHVEVFQQRIEIEVLKMCQHPNIISLLDLFENSEYYFMILEFMQGSDLFDYL